MAEREMALNLPLQDLCPQQAITCLRTAQRRSAREPLGRTSPEQTSPTPHLCLAFIRTNIQPLLVLHGYTSLDNLYFHEEARRKLIFRDT